jgi:hypothetical protein
MRRRIVLAWLVTVPVLWIAAAQAQLPDDGRPKMKHSQVEAILKQEHERSLKDAAELLKFARELKVEIEKGDRHVLSMKAVRHTEEIEKLAKRIRGRMQRF